MAEYESVGNDFIKRDLKRLKRLKSLETDISNYFKIIEGQINECNFSPYTSPIGDYLTCVEQGGEKIDFYKRRIAIVSPKVGTSNGGRLVFGVAWREKKFVPILVFSANEEKGYYEINKKKHRLSKSGIIRIINEKITD